MSEIVDVCKTLEAEQWNVGGHVIGLHKNIEKEKVTKRYIESSINLLVQVLPFYFTFYSEKTLFRVD